MSKSVKVVVTIELDQEAYDKRYGPGSDDWRRYHGKGSYGWTEEKEADAKARHEKSYSEAGAADAIVDCLQEGFYDWACNGWLKLSIQGHTICDKCSGVDGHKDWCEKIAGPEASA